MSELCVQTLAVAVLLLLSISIYAAQTFKVTIIDRQNNSGSYTYIVPGYSNSTSNTTANCIGSSNIATCNASTTTTGSSTPGFAGSYQVTGATLSLQLPDGRVAVVNCNSKLNWTEWSNPTVYRSCRVPLVNNLQAEFDGDRAKLRWSVSIDGKKMESETYKILAVLQKPEETSGLPPQRQRVERGRSRTPPVSGPPTWLPIFGMLRGSPTLRQSPSGYASSRSPRR